MYTVKHTGYKLECIQEDTKELNKRPQHLALIVHEEKLSHTDLAKVVSWAFAAGIHNVSIYSSQGECTCTSTRFGNVLKLHTVTTAYAPNGLLPHTFNRLGNSRRGLDIYRKLYESTTIIFRHIDQGGPYIDLNDGRWSNVMDAPVRYCINKVYKHSIQ